MVFGLASCGGEEKGDESKVSSATSANESTKASETSSEPSATTAPVTDYSWTVLSETNATATNIVAAVKDQDGDGVIRVGCLGDSITAGTQATNWPKHLQAYLDALGATNGNTYKVYNHGKGGAAVHHYIEEVGDPNWGWSTVVDEDGDGQAYFYYDDNAYRTSADYVPDVMIVQFGTNDSLGGNWAAFDEYFKKDYYEYLIKPFEEKGALVVLATPPYAAEASCKDNINGKIRDTVIELAHELNLPVVDTNIFQWGHTEAMADGLHGNLTGYHMMAQNYAKYIFGADMLTATFPVKEGTLLRLTDTATNESYTKAADGTELTISFVPGTYTFNITLECLGYKTITDTITLSEDKTFTYEQKEGGTNLALDGKGIQCDSKVYTDENDHTAASLIDGDRTSNGYQPEKWTEGDWCGVEFDTATVGEVDLYWETAAYISEYKDKGYKVEFKVDGKWKEMDAKNATVTRKAYEGDIVVDVIELKNAVNCSGVKITFLNGTITDHKYAPKLYELEVLEA